MRSMTVTKQAPHVTPTPSRTSAPPRLGVVRRTSRRRDLDVHISQSHSVWIKARNLLAEELARLRITRPLIVTDPGLIASGLVAQVVGSVGRHAVVFSEIQSNPAEEDVLAGLNCYHDAECDGVIGVGGGSPIDAAKAIRLMVSHPGRLADYDLTRGGQDKITAGMPPMIAVPTTAGTGSEAGRGTLIQLPQTGRKTMALSPHLLPTTAICDPDLTRELPPALTAGTGMDAFTHCIESYLSTTFHPSCEGIAVEGLPAIRFQGLRDSRPRQLQCGSPQCHDDGGPAGRRQLPQGAGGCPLTLSCVGFTGSRSPWHIECDHSSARPSL